MLPPTFMVTGKVVQSSVLPKLERVSGVRACRFCLDLHTVCGCGQVPLWSHTSTGQSPATVTMAHSHTSTSMSTSTACPPPGLLPLGGIAAATVMGTYSKALTFNLPPQTQMRGVSHPPSTRRWISCSGPLPKSPHPQNGGSNKAGAFNNPENQPRTPYQKKVQAPVLSTHSTGISRGALKELMKKRSEELECQTANVGHWTGALHQESGSYSKEA